MTEQITGELVDERPVDGDPVDMRLVLPVDTMRELATGIGKVLEAARMRCASDPADWVATFVAPELAARDAKIAEQARELLDARLQVSQVGAALAEMTRELHRYGVLAHRRHEVAVRLRTELAAALRGGDPGALADAERFRGLTEQRCPVGLHDGWFAPSAGKQHPCPWCLISELTGHVQLDAGEPGAAPADWVGALIEVVQNADGDLECGAHGPHPHAGLPCPDCPTCQGGAS